VSGSYRNIIAMNGFGRVSLTIAEALELYMARYPVLPKMRLPSGGWKIAVNSVNIPVMPTPGRSNVVAFSRRSA
jgi:hypothetical protein